MEQKKLDSEELRQQFEGDNFDPIKYINEQLPDENALQNLDSIIDNLNEELVEMNTELTSTIHDHALNNIELRKEIQSAHQTTQNIIQEINTIKDKAQKSENLVHEMCKDIKSLDIAKKNLTFSITALKKFMMMMTAVDKLATCCENKQYKDVAHLIQAFEELSDHFSRYKNIPQILDLFKQKEKIIQVLKIQLVEDFEAFQRQATTLSPQDMADACHVIEAMGVQYKNEVTKKIQDLALQGYSEAFQAEDQNNLQNYDRRFAWLKRNLQEFENRWNSVFPHYWAIPSYIIYEFCSRTRLDLAKILDREAHQTDVQVLMQSLQVSIYFEVGVTEDMKNRYKQYIALGELDSLEGEDRKEKEEELDPQVLKLKQEKGQFMLQRLPKFRGSISASFEQYMDRYIDMEERDLNIYISKIIRQNQEQDNLLNSCLFLLTYIKTLTERATQYSKSQLILNIMQIVQDGLMKYSLELQKLLQEEIQNKNTTEEEVLKAMCVIINTAEFCKDKMMELEDFVRSNTDPGYVDNISFASEEDLFQDVINKGIELLLGYLGKKVDTIFADILKGVNNVNTEMGEIQLDQNKCMQLIQQQLSDHVSKLRNLDEIQFISYLNKLVVNMNQKFLNIMYKFQNFDMDAQSHIVELESCLKKLAKKENDDRKTQSYESFVRKTFTKTKNIFNLLAMPNENFVQSFKNLFSDAKEEEIDKIVKIKGINRVQFYQEWNKLLQ